MELTEYLFGILAEYSSCIILKCAILRCLEIGLDIRHLKTKTHFDIAIGTLKQLSL